VHTHIRIVIVHHKQEISRTWNKRLYVHPHTRCYRTPQTGNFTDMELRTAAYAHRALAPLMRKNLVHDTQVPLICPNMSLICPNMSLIAGAADAQEPRPRYPGAA